MRAPRIHIGSLSTDSLRPEDVLPALAGAARRLRGSLPRDVYRDMRYYETHGYADSYDPDQPDPSETRDRLISIIEARLPPFLYCGSLPGNRADIGIWPDMHAIDDARNDGDLPEGDPGPDYRGLWLNVTDHGNVTLYCRTSRHLSRELWSCV